MFHIIILQRSCQETPARGARLPDLDQKGNVVIVAQPGWLGTDAGKTRHGGKGQELLLDLALEKQ
jgi:hypothetical protein